MRGEQGIQFENIPENLQVGTIIATIISGAHI
jgi:hypothetical protein